MFDSIKNYFFFLELMIILRKKINLNKVHSNKIFNDYNINK